MHETSDFLLYDNIFIYQVLCTLIYLRRSLYSFLFGDESISHVNNERMGIRRLPGEFFQETY